VTAPAIQEVRLRDLPVDEERGELGMYLFIATEALLFVSLFFSYFFLGYGRKDWPPHPPELKLALVLLVILLASSAVIAIAEEFHKEGRHGAARGLVLVVILMGVGFLVLQGFEYAQRLKEVTPTSGAYGSTFFALTGTHAAHVFLGLCMLTYVLIVPWGNVPEGRHPPHRALHVASLYWHFVDVVWVSLVALLYVLPHL
jgi:heme/copper-type cytochrome/quinol oxidase subunit 3